MPEGFKLYDYRGLTYQWRVGEQPDGAVEHKERAVSTKQRTPRNKGAQASGDRKR